MKFKVFDVFTRRIFEGNPTGVVYLDKGVDRAKMQKIANELSLPHTIFIEESKRPLLFNSLTFTPKNELPICTQGIIAGVFALIDDKIIPDGNYKVGTALGEREVFIGTPMERLKFPEVFVSVGMYSVEEIADKQLASFAKKVNLSFKGLRKNLVELGQKKRLVIEISYDLLAKIALPTNEVMTLCKELGIAGIAFFSQEADNLIHSRYFAASLNGAEDAVTGIAAGAILAFCIQNKIVKEFDDPTIHQGGYATREGYIYPKYRENQIFVGGRVIKTAEGKLFIY